MVHGPLFNSLSTSWIPSAFLNAGNTRIDAMRPGPHGTYFLALAIGMSL